jgi:hypothetical protein
MYEGRSTLAIVYPVETLQPSYRETYKNQAFPHPLYIETYGNPPK